MVVVEKPFLVVDLRFVFQAGIAEDRDDGFSRTEVPSDAALADAYGDC